MRQAAGMLWAVFFAAMLFGVWIFPILIAVFIIYGIIYVKWPDFFRKYL